jgi:hypothetical protein
MLKNHISHITFDSDFPKYYRKDGETAPDNLSACAAGMYHRPRVCDMAPPKNIIKLNSRKIPLRNRSANKQILTIPWWSTTDNKFDYRAYRKDGEISPGHVYSCAAGMYHRSHICDMAPPESLEFNYYENIYISAFSYISISTLLIFNKVTVKILLQSKVIQICLSLHRIDIDSLKLIANSRQCVAAGLLLRLHFTTAIFSGSHIFNNQLTIN